MLAGLLRDGKRGVEAGVRSERLQMFNIGLQKGMSFIHLQKDRLLGYPPNRLHDNTVN